MLYQCKHNPQGFEPPICQRRHLTFGGCKKDRGRAATLQHVASSLARLKRSKSHGRQIRPASGLRWCKKARSYSTLTLALIFIARVSDVGPLEEGCTPSRVFCHPILTWWIQGPATWPEWLSALFVCHRSYASSQGTLSRRAEKSLRQR